MQNAEACFSSRLRWMDFMYDGKNVFYEPKGLKGKQGTLIESIDC